MKASHKCLDGIYLESANIYYRVEYSLTHKRLVQMYKRAIRKLGGMV